MAAPAGYANTPPEKRPPALSGWSATRTLARNGLVGNDPAWSPCAWECSYATTGPQFRGSGNVGSVATPPSS